MTDIAMMTEIGASPGAPPDPMPTVADDVLVYRYGLLPPGKNADLARDQMRKAHAYRNTLVEIERGRRHAERAAYSSHGNVAELEESVAAARAREEAAAAAVM